MAKDLRSEGLLHIDQVAEAFFVSKRTVERLIRNPLAKFPTARRNGPTGRPRYWDTKEIKAFKKLWFND